VFTSVVLTPIDRLSASGPSRRALLIAPLVLGGWCLIFRQTTRTLPEPAAEGSGLPVTLWLCSNNGQKTLKRTLRKIAKTDEQWRAELPSDVFAVTRRAATEFAFANKFWNEHRPGLYRCICCATALFSSGQKFDSGTGWPSFTTPVAGENIVLRPDRTRAELRTEVQCRKCDAHLGHLFEDGPPPGGLRYCLNSAALSFVS
jgi:peptide-methionine (R)-S-oxide reductase